MPENKTITDHLKVLFTEGELRQKGLTLAQTMGEIDHLENEKKAVQSDFKGKIDAKSADVKKLKDQINNGYDYLPVKCEIRYNQPTPGMKTIVRLDTLEVVSSVEMNGDERRMKITDLSDLEQADAPFTKVEGGKKSKKKPDVVTETTQDEKDTLQEGTQIVPDPPGEGDDVTLYDKDNVYPEEITDKNPDKKTKSKSSKKTESDLKKVDKKMKKTVPYDAFATRTADWFIDRIGKDIEAKNASPKKFTGVMKIDDQQHAEYLSTVSQNQGGFSYRDVQNVS